jgi:hypothetical protein
MKNESQGSIFEHSVAMHSNSTRCYGFCTLDDDNHAIYFSKCTLILTHLYILAKDVCSS